MCYEKMLNITNGQRHAKPQYHLISVMMAIIKQNKKAKTKSQKIVSVGKDAEKSESLYTGGGNVLV